MYISIFALIFVALGVLWYWIFQNVGYKKIESKPSLVLSYLFSFFNRIVALAALAFMIQLGQIQSFWGGFTLGIILGIGFVGTTLFSQVIWGKMTVTKCLVHLVFNLIGLSVFGGLFAILP